MAVASLGKIADKLKLVNLTDKMNLEEHKVIIPDVNRPALQLNGFYEHFEKDRLQLIGSVEHAGDSFQILEIPEKSSRKRSCQTKVKIKEIG